MAAPSSTPPGTGELRCLEHILPILKQRLGHPKHPAVNTHLLEAVNHEEDVGVAHLGLFSFAVHGVFAGGRKHLLKGKQEERAEKPASTEKRPQIRPGERGMLLRAGKAGCIRMTETPRANPSPQGREYEAGYVFLQQAMGS